MIWTPKDFKLLTSVIFQADPHFLGDYDISAFQNIAMKIKLAVL